MSIINTTFRLWLVRGFEKKSSQPPNEPKNNIFFLNFHILKPNLFLGGLSMKK